MARVEAVTQTEDATGKVRPEEGLEHWETIEGNSTLNLCLERCESVSSPRMRLFGLSQRSPFTGLTVCCIAVYSDGEEVP